MDVEDGQTLIIIDIPYVYEDNKTIKFETLPMGFLTVLGRHIITISSRQTGSGKDQKCTDKRISIPIRRLDLFCRFCIMCQLST